jgi:hypothetical protein
MKKRIMVLYMLVAVAIAFLVGWRFWMRAPKAVVQVSQAGPAPVKVATPAVEPAATLPAEYPQLSIKTMSRAEATRAYVARIMSDHEADWKIPINFFGEVLDENGQPIAGAEVKYQWNTIGVSSGTSYAEATSDGNGRFSLTEQRGKVLSVRVQKEAYYPVENGNSTLSFEYADPSSPYFYEADLTHPAIFHLHSKGLNATPLLHWKRDVALNEQNQKSLDLKSGNTTEGGSSSLSIAVLNNSNTVGSFAWSAKISVIGGGLQIDTDQFPFIAPSTGYEPSVNVNMDTPKPPTWQGYQGAAVYVQTSEGFGRYEIRMLLGQHSVEVEGFFNAMPGSRNLEPISK